MIEFKVKGDAKSFLRKAKSGLDKGLLKGVLDASLLLEGNIKQSIFATTKSGKGGLARSFKAVPVLQKSGDIVGGVYSNLIYAGVQDRPSTTIKPKSCKNLAIPVSQEAKTAGKWPRTFAPGRLSFLKSKNGNKLLVEFGKGSKESFKVHFVLKSSVTIKGKGYLAAAKKASTSMISQLLGNNISIGIKNGVR